MTIPIYEAASNGHDEALALLMEHGADIDERYGCPWKRGTALFHACEKVSQQLGYYCHISQISMRMWVAQTSLH